MLRIRIDVSKAMYVLFFFFWFSFFLYAFRRLLKKLLLHEKLKNMVAPVRGCISILAISPGSLACAPNHRRPRRALRPRGWGLGTLSPHLLRVGEGRVLGHWVCTTVREGKTNTVTLYWHTDGVWWAKTWSYWSSLVGHNIFRLY